MKTREARRIRRTHRGRASFNNDGRHSAQNGASPRRRRPQKTALRLGRRSQRARFSRGTTSGRSELTEAVPPSKQARCSRRWTCRGTLLQPSAAPARAGVLRVLRSPVVHLHLTRCRITGGQRPASEQTRSISWPRASRAAPSFSHRTGPACRRPRRCRSSPAASRE